MTQTINLNRWFALSTYVQKTRKPHLSLDQCAILMHRWICLLFENTLNCNRRAPIVLELKGDSSQVGSVHFDEHFSEINIQLSLRPPKYFLIVNFILETTGNSDNGLWSIFFQKKILPR